MRGLIINRFDIGITLKTKGGNKIEGNYIGTDATGMMRRPNHTMGIYIQNTSNNLIGGTLADSRNVISGNGSADSCGGLVDLLTDAYGQSGISIVGNNADQNIIQGNYIGTDKNGTGSVYNNCLGIGISTNATLNIIGGTTPQARNLISGNLHMEGNSPQGWGIYLVSINGSPLAATIQGNYIGTDVNGASALENGKGLVVIAPQNTIGGTSAGAGNLISGNREQGIYLESFPVGTPANVGGNRVQGNLIGVDATQTQALPNNMGIEFHNQTNLLVGGTSAEAGNVISGNTTYGIFALVTNATGIRVQGNSVGTDAQGTANLGNGIDGMYIASSPDTSIAIGGKQQDAGNRIAYNGRHGVSSTNSFTGFPGTTIRGNTIFDNTGEGINSFPDTAIPSVRSSQYSSNKLKIKGSLNGEANKTYNLDFYANASCDTGEFGEGKTYLGSKDITTDASGNANYEFLADNVPDGTVVTATATRGGTFTGSFSRCRTMTAAAQQAYAATSGDCDGNTPCYNSINDAIDAADPDGTVNIAPGTYNQDIVLNGDVQLNMGDSNGGGGGGDNRADKKVARKIKQTTTEATTDANDYILNGSLSILNGNFQAPSTNLYISGNLTLQSPGNFNNNGGTVILNGSGTQRVDGDFNFNHWTINSGVFADVHDSQPFVDGTFTNNGVAQNWQTQTVNDPDFFQRFYDVTGRTTAKLLNTGSPDLGAMQVTINQNQTPSNQTACNNNNLPTNMVSRWYDLHRAAGNETGINATIRLYYQANELNNAIASELAIYHCNTTTHQWEALTSTRGSDSAGQYVQAQNVETFSPFGIGSPNAPTSVVVSRFHAKANKKPAVRLLWRTENELQVLGFNIWKAENDGAFVQMNDTLVPAQNPGAIGSTKYKYADANVRAGQSYSYRLETVLANGISQNTEPITVRIPNARCAQPEAVTLLTPTNGEKTKRKLTLDWSDANCTTTYELLVRHGGKQKQEIVNDNTLRASEYSFNKLDKGKYQWRVRACNDNGCGEWSKWAKFIVQGKSNTE